MQDIRYALRALRAYPGFAAVTIASLALGIGANTAIFSLIDAVMLRSIPVSHPGELLQVTSGTPQIFSNPIWEQIRDRQDVFSSAFAYGRWRFNLATAGEAHYANGGFVAGHYFETLGVPSLLGRALTPADDRRGCPGAAVLSYGFWQREYGGRGDILRKTISLDTHPIEIVGVTGPGFTGIDVGSTVDVFVPLCSEKVIHGQSSNLDWNAAPRNYNTLFAWLRIIGRLKPGISLEQASARLKTLAPGIYNATVPPHWSDANQDAYRKRTLSVENAATGVSYLRRQYRQALLVLMAIAGLVLLIACANVANLLLARGAGRQREMAIRLALGSGRARLVRQLLIESLLLSLLGAALGVLAAQWSVRLLARYLDVFLVLTPDVRVLAFTAGVAVVTGLLFGIAPAWRGTRVQPVAAMKANSRGVIEGSKFGFGKILVMAQIALSLLLVVGAGLLLSTFWRLATVDVGFDAQNTLLMTVDLIPRPRMAQEKDEAYRLILERVGSIPGVRSAGASYLAPLCGCGLDKEIILDNGSGIASFNRVSSGYFATLRIALAGGRDFNAGDTPSSAPVAMINQRMARKYFAGANPLGRHFRFRDGKQSSAPVEIVGIVKDAKFASLREEITPTIYLPLTQDDDPDLRRQFELNAANGSPAALIAAAKLSLGKLGRDVSLEFTPLPKRIDESLTRERVLATLSGFFGALALLLAAVGLYGVMSYNVARRRNEVGIRMALGAQRQRVLRMILGEVALLICSGLAVGILLSLAASRFVTSFLYGMKPTDPVTLIGAVAVLAGAAAIAGYLPARRASRLDPMNALREE